MASALTVTTMKPECYGCELVGEEKEYYWHDPQRKGDGHLWHMSCINWADTQVRRTKDPAKDRIDFVVKLFLHNRALQENYKAKNFEAIDKFITKVLAPKGYTKEEVLKIFTDYDNSIRR